VENPVSPENTNPLNNANPMDDPLLDALEHSIENPLGFTDPLAEYDNMQMDNIARQLQNLESGIDNSSPVFDTPDTIKNGNELNIHGGNLTILEPSLLSDNPKPSETVNNLRDAFQNSPPHTVQDSSARTVSREPCPKTHRKGGSRGQKQRHLSLKRNIGRQIGRATAGISNDLSYCLENHEFIDKETCQLCEKYRHWPQGIDEEPRECWYAWQVSQSTDEPDENNE